MLENETYINSLSDHFNDSTEEVNVFCYLKNPMENFNYGPNLKSYVSIKDIPVGLFDKDNWIDGYFFNKDCQVGWRIDEDSSLFIADGGDALDLGEFEKVEREYLIKNNARFEGERITVTEYLRFDNENLSWEVARVLLNNIEKGVAFNE